VLAFGAGALVSFASLVALGSLGLFKAWLVLSVLVLVGCLVALLARRTRLRPVALAGGWLTVPALLFVLFGWMAGTLFDGLPRTRSIARSGSRRTRRITPIVRAWDGERSAVQRTLGSPDARRGLDPRSARRAALGRDGACGSGASVRKLIDDLWLALRFGPDGRVESHRIAEDWGAGRRAPPSGESPEMLVGLGEHAQDLQQHEPAPDHVPQPRSEAGSRPSAPVEPRDAGAPPSR
jgi:hypothetical protein